MKTNANQPAFPISEEATDRIDADISIYTGLTKREFFAAMAMRGLMANGRHAVFYQRVAADSVEAADKLIAELEKPQP
jgi:hypothetical protein